MKKEREDEMIFIGMVSLTLFSSLEKTGFQTVQKCVQVFNKENSL